MDSPNMDKVSFPECLQIIITIKKRRVKYLNIK